MVGGMIGMIGIMSTVIITHIITRITMCRLVMVHRIIISGHRNTTGMRVGIPIVVEREPSHE